MALFKKESMSGMEMIRTVIIDDDVETIQMGDVVNLRNGNVEVGTANGAVAGVVVGLVDKNGNSVFGSVAVLGSATVTGTERAGSVTAATDNETVDLIAAQIDVSPFTIYSGSVTGTVGATVSSDKIGVWVDMVDEQDINETTATRTVTTEGQLYGWGKDPDDTTRMLVSIHEHEIFNYGGTMA